MDNENKRYFIIIKDAIISGSVILSIFIYMSSICMSNSINNLAGSIKNKDRMTIDLNNNNCK